VSGRVVRCRRPPRCSWMRSSVIATAIADQSA
jgi:hypothetical protein